MPCVSLPREGNRHWDGKVKASTGIDQREPRQSQTGPGRDSIAVPRKQKGVPQRVKKISPKVPVRYKTGSVDNGTRSKTVLHPKCRKKQVQFPAKKALEQGVPYRNSVLPGVKRRLKSQNYDTEGCVFDRRNLSERENDVESSGKGPKQAKNGTSKRVGTRKGQRQTRSTIKCRDERSRHQNSRKHVKRAEFMPKAKA